jgi:hypothetical protein
MKYLKYLKYLLAHKFWVSYYCFKNKLYLRGFLHDWTKFLPDEFVPYMNFFYGKKGAVHRGAMQSGYYKPYKTDDEKFDFAWLKHQNRNKHHWQWWVLPKDDGTILAMRMKRKYIVEMVCDWRGAGKAQGFGDNTKSWYEENKDKMTLHPETRSQVEDILNTLYGEPKNVKPRSSSRKAI